VPLNSIEILLWALGTLLQLSLCALIFWRGLHRRLPIFTSYAVLVLFGAILVWWVYHHWGYQSRTGWYFAWAAQGVALFARGAAVAELCWRILRAYSGVWGLAWRVLALLAILLTAQAMVAAEADAHWVVPLVLTADRGLETMIAAVLLALLATCAYYRIRVEPPYRWIVVGLCFNSIIQALNNSFLRNWLSIHIFFWNGVHLASSDIAIVVWCVALWKPLPVERPAPVLLGQQAYDELTPQVNYRLRMLNRRLLEILRS
jgi:hypothetical protein